MFALRCVGMMPRGVAHPIPQVTVFVTFMEGSSRCQAPRSGKGPFARSQVFRRVTERTHDDSVVADRGNLQHGDETNVAGWLPGNPWILKQSSTAWRAWAPPPKLASRGALGRAVTASMSGDKRLPSPRPDSLPSEVFRKLPKSARKEMQEEPRRMNAERWPSYLQQIKDSKGSDATDLGCAYCH